MLNLTRTRLEGLKREIENLSPQEKAQLQEALGYNWVDCASVELLGRLLRAIALRLESRN